MHDRGCELTTRRAQAVVWLVAAGVFANTPGSAEADWITYRGDSERTGRVAAALELPLELAWTYTAPKRPAPAWPAPAKRDIWNERDRLAPRVVYDRAFHVVAKAGRVYFGSSADHKLYCLDLATGAEQWSFFTEGPVRLAPSLSPLGIHFGSDDGSVYTLGYDGRLLWSIRVGPNRRRVAGNGALISPWPVRTGVLVEGDTLRVCAGLFPEEGVWQVALDARTGRELGRGALGISPQGYLTVSGDDVIVPNGRGKPEIVARLERRGRGSAAAAIEIPTRFRYAQIETGEITFAGGDGEVAAFSNDDGRKLWSARVQGVAWSLAATAGRLLASTSEGVVHCFASEVSSVPPRTANGRRARSSDAPSEFVLAREWSRGWGVVFGSGDGTLLARLARDGPERRLAGYEWSPELVDLSRQRLDRAGVYGRVAVFAWDRAREASAAVELTCLANRAFVTARGAPFVEPAAAFHAVRPGGALFLEDTGTARDWDEWRRANAAHRDPEMDQKGWRVYRRPAVPGGGSWTHLYADAANSASSGDQRVDGRLRLQWFGEPGPREMLDRHHRAMAPLCRDGRLIVPGDGRVFAVDAYNGTPLWTREIDESRRLGVGRDAGSMALGGANLYVASGATCLALDAATGNRVAVYSVPAPSAASRWGWVALDGARVYGSAAKPDGSRRELGRTTIDEIYNDHQAIVTSDAVFAFEKGAARPAWRYGSEKETVLNPTLTVGGGRVYFVRVDAGAAAGRTDLKSLLSHPAAVVALDSATGEPIWSRELDLSPLEHAVYLVFAENRLVLCGSRNANGTVWFDFWGLDANSGAVLWAESQDNGVKAGGNHGEKDYHPVVMGDRIYLEPFARSLSDGSLVPDWGWPLAGKRRGCGTFSASARALFFRHASATAFDLESRTLDPVTRVTRPGCWINMIPAGGMVLVPEASSGCTCDHPVQTSLGFIAESILR